MKLIRFILNSPTHRPDRFVASTTVIAVLLLWLQETDSIEQPYVSNTRILFTKMGISPMYTRYAPVKFSMNTHNLTSAAYDILELMDSHMGRKTHGWNSETDSLLTRMDEPHEAYRHLSHEFPMNNREERYHSLQSRLHVLINKISSFTALFQSSRATGEAWRTKNPEMMHYLYALPNRHSNRRNYGTRQSDRKGASHSRSGRSINQTLNLAEDTTDFEQPGNALHRDKRGVGSFMLGALITSAVTIAAEWIGKEIVGLVRKPTVDTAPPEDIKSKLMDYQTSMRLGYSMNDTAFALRALAEADRHQKAWGYKDDTLRRFKDAVAILEQRFEYFMDAWSAAAMGRLHPQVMIEVDFRATAAAVQVAAEDANLRPAGVYLSDWLQYEAAFAKSDTGFDIILMVPMFDPDRVLTVLRHHPLPIPLIDNIHLTVSPSDYTYIAIDAEGNNFRAMTNSQFESCRRNGDMIFCDKQSYTRKAPEFTVAPYRDGELCIFALAARKFELAATACQTHFASGDTAMEMISPSEFAIYSAQPKGATVTCPGAQSSMALTVQNLSLVHLPPGCHGKTEDFDFSTADSSFDRVVAQWAISYDWPLGLETFTKNVDPAILASILDKSADLLDETSKLTLRRAFEAVAAITAPVTPEEVHYTVTPVVSILLSISALVVALVALSRTRRSSDKKHGLCAALFQLLCCRSKDITSHTQRPEISRPLPVDQAYHNSEEYHKLMGPKAIYRGPRKGRPAQVRIQTAAPGGARPKLAPPRPSHQPWPESGSEDGASAPPPDPAEAQVHKHLRNVDLGRSEDSNRPEPARIPPPSFSD